MADAFSSTVMTAWEYLSTKVIKMWMSDKSADGTGGRKRELSASHLVSGVVAGPAGAVRVGMEVGAGISLFSKAPDALPSITTSISSASLKLLRFAALIAAPLAFLAALCSSLASWDRSHLHLLNAFLSSSTNFPNLSYHQGAQKWGWFTEGNLLLDEICNPRDQIWNPRVNIRDRREIAWKGI
jgi:hypothetical protein